MASPPLSSPKDPQRQQTADSQWTIDDSATLYGLRDWGHDYFDISPDGDVLVRANSSLSESGSDTSASVSLMDIVQGMKDRGLEMPVILRIENLLDDRIRALNEAFRRAISRYNYPNEYRGVFPVKVNQQCHVIEEIADFGRHYHHGFEVGSKAELLIALSYLNDTNSLVICNGFKDTEFIELGLYAKEMGLPCIFVLETASELSIIIKTSRRLGIEPVLGVRIRSTIVVEGHWSQDSGDSSIFGLSSVALLEVVEQLKDEHMLDCLQMLHCHLGSQIPNIRNIRAGVLEACRFYCGLVAEGAPMGYLDLGGGLAVDYEGKRSTSSHSRNYKLDEYCDNIVETIVESLEPLNIEMPVIITESGRATVAYSSLLLFNILDVRDHSSSPLPEKLDDDLNEHIYNLWKVKEHINKENYQECYNNALYYRDEVRDLFRRGQVSLREQGLADNLALAIFEIIAAIVRKSDQVASEMECLPELLADIYYGNFSLFQSLPDIWAINQILPIMPIQRLNEKPSQNAVITDLTCDCDGKINHFSTPQGVQSTLKLHKIEKGNEYHLGVFLVGAYQETLGDLHNLFGDTNVVSVKILEDGKYQFRREFHGDCVADVLSYVEYDPKIMIEKFRKRAENAVESGAITASQRKQTMKAFKESLDGYTYFEKEVY